MSLTPLTWRLHHPKCVFCRWLKYDNTERLGLGCSGYFKCQIKEKIIRYINLPRHYCQCYEVKHIKEFEEKNVNEKS